MSISHVQPCSLPRCLPKTCKSQVGKERKPPLFLSNPCCSSICHKFNSQTATGYANVWLTRIPRRTNQFKPGIILISGWALAEGAVLQISSVLWVCLLDLFFNSELPKAVLTSEKAAAAAAPIARNDTCLQPAEGKISREFQWYPV